MENEFWQKVFEGYENIQPEVKNAIKRVYDCYDCMPCGICDPMYIMNTIALELGIGDGNGNFFLNKEKRYYYESDGEKHCKIHYIIDKLEDRRIDFDSKKDAKNWLINNQEELPKKETEK